MRNTMIILLVLLAGIALLGFSNANVFFYKLAAGAGQAVKVTFE